MEYQEKYVNNLNYYFNGLGNFSDFGDGAYVLKGKEDWVYIVNGKIHKDDGPARIFHDLRRGELVYCFIFYKHGERHCETGPAYIAYSMADSAIIHQDFYLNGKWIVDGKWQQQIQTKLYW